MNGFWHGTGYPGPGSRVRRPLDYLNERSTRIGREDGKTQCRGLVTFRHGRRSGPNAVGLRAK